MDSVRVVARRWLGILVAGLVLAAAGCGSKLHQVEGKIKFKDGSPIDPLVGGQVVFEPVDGATTAARGDIQTDGSFRLGTDKPGNGAPPGKYKVLVKPPDLPPKEEKLAKTKPKVIHPRYQSKEDTPLEFTVPREDDNYPITVEKP
jgi:hypothetical protein